MRQALHIFQKDTRGLRLDIALFLLTLLLFTWAELRSSISGAVEVLMIIGGIFLMGRLVHGEPIAGSGQFWITRPYRWRSLMLSKLLFFVLWIDIPIGIARLSVLAAQGYPIGANMPALIWSQCLLFLAGLPILAVAALTSGIMQFSLALLGTALGAVIALDAIPLTFLGGFEGRIPIWPVAIEWIQHGLLAIPLVAAGVAVLLWQYRDRSTTFSRTVALAAAAIATLLYFAFPLTVGLAVQSWFSHGPVPPVQVVLDSGKRINQSEQRHENAYSETEVARLPLLISGLPEDAEIRSDALRVTVAWPDGHKWSGAADVFEDPNEHGHARLRTGLRIPRQLFERTRGMAALVSGTLYATLFGSAESRTIPFSRSPVNAQDGLQCYDGGVLLQKSPSSVYGCRAFFGWPSRLVSVSAANYQESLTKLVSYSPFPSGLGIDMRESRYATLASTEAARESGVTITTRKPLVHFHRDFELRDVRLADYIAP